MGNGRNQYSKTPAEYTKHDAWRIRCPWCGVPAGATCVNSDNSRYRLSIGLPFHRRRIKTAERLRRDGRLQRANV